MEEKEKGYPELVEALSLLTALSFLLSAAINAIKFWRAFHLNYFSIAVPSDVVMSGFVNIASAMFTLTLIFAVGTLGFRRITGRKLVLPRGILFFLFGAMVAPLAFVTTAIQTESRPVNLRATGINGLVLAPNGPYSAQCGAAPVLWLGSASAVVNCRGRVFVIHNTQALAMVRP